MNPIKAAAVLLLLVLITPVLCSGQDLAPQDTVTVTTNLVTINVIVTDKQGRYVNGLTANKFVVDDENIKQKISHFAVGDAPTSISIICEIHPTSPQQVSAVLGAIRQFVLTLNERDTFSFTAYGPAGSVTTDFVPSAQQVIDHLQGVKPGGPSSLFDVVYAASERLQQSSYLKRALLIISDGNDGQSNCSYDMMRNRLREFDVQIYTIGIAGATADSFNGSRHWMFEDVTRQTGKRFFRTPDEMFGKAVLDEMSRSSGGSTFSPELENEPELVEICNQIALELRRQYTIGFYPTDTTPGKWHRLKVHIDGTSLDLSLSYRSGYQIPVQTEHINF